MSWEEAERRNSIGQAICRDLSVEIGSSFRYAGMTDDMVFLVAPSGDRYFAVVTVEAGEAHVVGVHRAEQGLREVPVPLTREASEDEPIETVRWYGEERPFVVDHGRPWYEVEEGGAEALPPLCSATPDEFAA